MTNMPEQPGCQGGLEVCTTWNVREAGSPDSMSILGYQRERAPGPSTYKKCRSGWLGDTLIVVSMMHGFMGDWFLRSRRFGLDNQVCGVTASIKCFLLYCISVEYFAHNIAHSTPTSACTDQNGIISMGGRRVIWQY